MKKVTYEKWCHTCIENLCVHFNFTDYAFTLKFHSEAANDRIAEIAIDTQYMRAQVALYPCFRDAFDRRDERQLVETLVHEMVHVLVEPFDVAIGKFLSDATRPDFLHMLEQQTQRITYVMLKGLPANLIPPLPPR